MKRLRVLVLMHADQVPPGSIEGLSDKDISPWRMEYDVITALHELGHEVRPLGLQDELMPARRAISEWKPHIVFNLIMHFHDVGLYDAHVVSYLELLRQPYTGCNPRGLLLANDKALSKKVMAWHRIPVPAFASFRQSRKRKRPARLNFPLIVKSVGEHASMGIAQASIVHDDESLRDRVAFIHRTVGTDAIAEEYIKGRELTIGVIGNERLTTFPIRELKFESLPEHSEPIQTSKVKWDLDYQKKVGAYTKPADDLPEEVARGIAKLAKRVYRALDQSGFARIDLRMNESGKVFVLEANPNPDLCLAEDFAQSARDVGLDYRTLVQKILTLGLNFRPLWKKDPG